MNIKTKLIIIAKDDYPLELFKDSPLVNFLRKKLLGKHLECKECYERRKGIKVNDSNSSNGMTVEELYRFIIKYKPNDWVVPDEKNIHNVTKKEAEAEVLGYNKANNAWLTHIKGAFKLFFEDNKIND